MGIADSTRRTYGAAVRKYQQFCNLYGIEPLPASETTLRYFCIHAYRTIAHRSIKVYLAAIRHYHLENGFRDPLAHTPLLHYLERGIQRHQGDTSKVRLPITISILRTLQHALRHRKDRAMLWAALTLTFYGFLRGSEVTSPSTKSFNKHRHLCRRDLIIDKDKSSMSVTIKASKTDPFRRSTIIPIAATGTSTCPVRAMCRYFSATRHHRRSQPLFVDHAGHYLTRQKLTSVLRALLEAAGYPKTHQYSSHSLRIGAATAAAGAGLPTWLIQAAGRWRSDAYKLYIRTPKKKLLAVAPTISRVKQSHRRR